MNLRGSFRKSQARRGIGLARGVAVITAVATLALGFPSSAVAQLEDVEDLVQDPPGAEKTEKAAVSGDASVKKQPPLPAAPKQTPAFKEGAERSQEIKRLRSQRSRTFTNSYGAHETEVFTESIHYRGNGGSWRRVDNTIVEDGSPGYAYQNRANRYRVQLPPGLGNSPVRVTKGKSWITLKLVGGSGRVSPQDNQAMITEAVPGVDVRYTVLGDVVKEDLLLKSATATREFEWRLQASPDLTTSENVAGGIDLKNSVGQTVFALPQPFIHDASLTDEGIAPPHKLRLSSSGGAKKVSLSVDQTWLSDESREFPITVDPAISMAERDCWIANGNKSANSSCGGSVLQVGYNGTYKKRGLVKFDLSESVIPENAEVLHAEAGLYVTNVPVSGWVDLAFRPLTEGWSTNATWDQRVDGTDWAGGGGGTFDSSQGYLKNSEYAAEGWYYWHPTALVKRWVSGDLQNSGAVIKDRFEDGGLVWLASSENANNRPKMTVTWDYGGMGKLKNYKLESRRLTDRMQVHANVAGGNLMVETTDLKIRGTGLDLEVKRHFNGLLETNFLDTATHVGEGWTLSTAGDIGLIFYRDNSAAFFGPSGYRLPFHKTSPYGKWHSPAGLGADLRNDQNTGYSIVEFRETKEKFYFSNSGLFMFHEDKNGNRIEMIYDANYERVEAIKDTQGRTTDLIYNSSGQLDLIIDPAGREYDYEYVGGQLVSYEDPERGVTRYDYGTGENLEEIGDPNGNETQFVYNTDGWIKTLRQVTNRVDDTGDQTMFTYFGDSSSIGCINNAEAPEATRVTDARGNVTKYCYNKLSRVREIHDAKGNLTSMDYNSEANVIRYVNPKEHEFAFQYDQTGQNLEQTISPGSGSGTSSLNGAVTSRSYGDDGHDHDGDGTTGDEHKHLPTELTTAEGNKTKMFYDENDRLIEVQQAPNTKNVVFSYSYNPDGTLDRLEAPPVEADADAQGNDTTFSYDAVGNLKIIHRPAPMGPMTFEYDEDGKNLSRVTSTVDGEGRRTEYTYDDLDRITQVRYLAPDASTAASTITYAYDQAGNLRERKDEAGTHIFTYDDKNQLKTETRGTDGSTITYGYNKMGDLSSIDDAGSVTQYRYDVTNVMDKIIEPDNDEIVLSIGKSYEPWKIAYPNGVAQFTSRHPSGKIREIRGEDNGVEFRKLTYDYTDQNDSAQEVSLLQKITDKHGKEVTYTYDPLGRLTREQTKSGTEIVRAFEYRYDKNSNRTYEDDDGKVTKYDYNDANQLTCAYTDGVCDSATERFTYDGEGNQLSEDDGTTYSYDARGFTRQITPPSGTPIAFNYQGADQKERTSKTIGEGTLAEEHSYRHDLLGLGREERPTETVEYLRNVDGKPIGHREKGALSTKDRYYITDHLGSVIDVTSGSGDVIQKYTFEPYGEVAWQKDVSIQNPYRFAQGYFDYETNMHKLGVRYYDQTQGRFTQLDPLFGKISQPMTLNRYQYANCNPANNIDPTGQESVSSDCLWALGEYYAGLAVTTLGILSLIVLTNPLAIALAVELTIFGVGSVIGGGLGAAEHCVE